VTNSDHVMTFYLDVCRINSL